MNKFRQIISSFLAMSLIISSSYTALAEVISSAGEGGNSAVYTEVFGADGSVNKFVTNYNETYKTKTSIEGYLKDDGDYAGKISAVRQGTSNNYADVRKVFGKNVVEDYFSITYDINFLEYDGTSDNSSVIVKLSTRNNKRGGGSIWGYGTNLFGNGSSADKVKVLSASNGAELDTNKWYKVKHYFDGVAHKEIMTVTDPETDDTIATIERTIHNDFYAIEMFSFGVCQPAEFLLDNVCVNSEAVSVSGFEEQYTTTDDISFNASLPAGFGVASLYANDEEIGTIVEENTSFYDVVITAGTLPEGEYDIRLDAYYDGALQSASASFKISDELVVISPKPGDNVLDGELFIAATAPKNMTVFATIDATNTIELVPDETDPGYYSATADVSEGYSMGSHKVIISAQKPDGSVMSAETGFSLNYKVLSKEYFQDFNLLATVGEIDDDTKKGTMGKVGFTFGNETGADFTVVPGPSGEEGDVAAHIQISTDKQLTASAPFIRCANFVNYNEGVTEFEFDIKLKLCNTFIVIHKICT
ncbi:MAG: hypothetical protein J6B23_04390, partial [Clostridia bacterium]|nr:hypothetical protein [Clostridia bacterium]